MEGEKFFVWNLIDCKIGKEVNMQATSFSTTKRRFTSVYFYDENFSPSFSLKYSHILIKLCEEVILSIIQIKILGKAYGL